MTKRIAAILKSDETESFGCIEPFDRALHRCLREGARVLRVEVRHVYADAAPAGNDPKNASGPSGGQTSASTCIMPNVKVNPQAASAAACGLAAAMETGSRGCRGG